MMSLALSSLLGFSLESSRVATDILFPQYLTSADSSSISSTLYLVALNGGSFIATLILTQEIGTTIGVVLAPLSFLILCGSYAALAYIPHYSTFSFLVLVSLIGFATSSASVSSSSLLQTAADSDAQKQQRLNAVYRVGGIISKLTIPIAIVMANEQQSAIFVVLSVTLFCTACVLQHWTRTSSSNFTKTAKTVKTVKSTNSSSKPIPCGQWLQVVLYCVIVSLPNVAGGLVRALLHTRATSVPIAHSFSQMASIATLFLTSMVLEAYSARKGTPWIAVAIQAALMSGATFGIIVSDNQVDIVTSFVAFRCVEESAKLTNSTILHQLAHVAQKKQSTRSRLQRFVASQKVIGAMLKMVCSLVSTHIIRSHGTISALVMANVLCAVGSLGLTYLAVLQNFCCNKNEKNLHQGSKTKKKQSKSKTS